MNRIILVVALVISSLLPLSAQSEMQMIPNPVIADILESYSPWYSAEFDGKLRQDKLPVSPGIKIYMVRDSLVQISIRVALLGELGMMELTNDNITVINKMKKTYCRETTDNLREMYPSFLSDLQSLLLARITVLGQGELNNTNIEMMQIVQDPKEGWLVLPNEDSLGALKYGYWVADNARTKALVGSLSDYSFEVDYTYPDKGMNMRIEFENKSKITEAQLDFSSVKWGGKPLQMPNLSKYKRLDIASFIKSFR